MMNIKAKLVSKCLDPKAVEQEPTRKGYGQGLLEAGEEDPRVVALYADLTETLLTSEAVGGTVTVLTPLPSRPCRDGSFVLRS